MIGDVDKEEVRCVLLHPMVAKRIEPKSSQLEISRLLAIHEHLNAFVYGDLITVSIPPPDNEDADLKCLQRRVRVVWEMRFRAPISERLLGLVPKTNVFIGLAMKPRNELEKVGFAPTANRCVDIWNRIPGSSKPDLITGMTVDKALSNWRSP